MSSALLPSSSAQAKLWKLEFSTSELGKQVTVADSSRDHDTSLALAQAVMLPRDVVDLAEEGSEEIRDLLVMQQVQSLQSAISEQMMEQSVEIKKSKKKINSLEKQTKLDSKAAEKVKLELAAAIQERDASYAAVIEARGEVVAIQEQLDKALGTGGSTELAIIMTSSWLSFDLVSSRRVGWLA
ncbi:uncharacterized protein LOC130750653 [Actinidia eriantha]|uniref:uncharacterized protein LOC130750653 n=1 Tax=Actinidia eriantha TaxID=165200 RepID=UPI00258AED8A|nr:uncharacterized protein LOC130750653 [Actinidia eriantha]